jgi:hypothetical protein
LQEAASSCQPSSSGKSYGRISINSARQEGVSRAVCTQYSDRVDNYGWSMLFQETANMPIIANIKLLNVNFCARPESFEEAQSGFRVRCEYTESFRFHRSGDEGADLTSTKNRDAH